MSWLSLLIGILLTIHVITSVLLVLIVLMQRPRSEGLGAAFGGGVTESLFGSGAGNMLTKITTGLGITFFATTMALALLYSHRQPGGLSAIRKAITAPPAVTATNAAPSLPPLPPVSDTPPSVTPPAPTTTPAPSPANVSTNKPGK